MRARQPAIELLSTFTNADALSIHYDLPHLEGRLLPGLLIALVTLLKSQYEAFEALFVAWILWICFLDYLVPEPPRYIPFDSQEGVLGVEILHDFIEEIS